MDDQPPLSNTELRATMLAILDIKAETRAIRELLEEDEDDEEDETDS